MRISDWSSDVCSSDLQIGLSRGDGGVFLFERGPEFARIAIDAEGAELRAPRAGGGIGRHIGTAFVDHADRSEEHTSELQSLMRNSYAVFCLKKKKKQTQTHTNANTSLQKQNKRERRYKT